MKITQDEVEFLVYCIKMGLDALLLRLTDGKGESASGNNLVFTDTEGTEAIKWHIEMARASLDRLLPHCQSEELVESASQAIDWFEKHVSYCDDKSDFVSKAIAEILMRFRSNNYEKNN